MPKKQSFLKATCMAVAALAALGCSQEEWTNASAPKGNTTIVASFDRPGADTRTSVVEDRKVVWNSGDAFGLFYTKEAGVNSVTPFTCSTLDETKDNTSASFGGPLDDNVRTSYAVYPYQKDRMTLEETTVTMELPAFIDYDKENQGRSNGPMYAAATDITKPIQFHHLAGLLKLTISSAIQADAKKFVITADKAIAGTCTADLGVDSPVLDVKGEGSKTIVVNLNFDTPTSIPTTFYIPVLAGTYGTLSAQLFDKDDQALFGAKEWKDIEVKRAGIRSASFGFVEINAGISSTNTAIAEAIKTVIPESPTEKTITEVQIDGNIDATNEDQITDIALPVYDKSDIKLSLAAVPTTSADKPLTLSDDANKEATPTTAINTVTVSIPQVVDGQSTPAIIIKMPKTTVVLDANDGNKATYGQVIATTATNTLVIKEGVTVEKLIVKGGNVEIHGIVKELVRDENNNKLVAVSSFGAADIKKVTDPGNFTFTSTWDGLSQSEPTDGNIYTAAQLAFYQSKQAPTDKTAKSLPETLTAVTTTLYADIDLADKPWLGMVIKGKTASEPAIEEKTFDGNGHTVKNLNMSQYILNQQETIYTPQACIGFFAAVYGVVTIKDITLDHVTIRPAAPSSPKWVGSLVGYSNGNVTTYKNCVAKNVDIFTRGVSSYRVGGLIGYIEECGALANTATATLTDCKVEGATIAASLSYGGLIGSMYDSVTLKNCSTSNIILSLNNECDNSYGYVSNFIGDIANEGTKERTVIIEDCKTDELTPEDEARLKIPMGGSKWCGIVEPMSVLNFTIEVITNGDRKKLTAGTDFNVVRNIAWDGSSAFEPKLEDNVYTITAPSELAWIAQQVENEETFAGKTIQLSANLDMGNKSWKPIGDNVDHKMINTPSGVHHETEYVKTVKYFKGTFDGQSHTISNLTVNHKYPGAGLFGNVQNATIKDFTVKDATIIGSSKWTAVVIGYSNGQLTVENVKVENAKINMESDTNGAVKLAGLVSFMNGSENMDGNNKKDILLKGCSVSGLTINGAHYNAAGLAGYIIGANSFRIEGCTTSDITIIRSIYDKASKGAANYSSPFLGCFGATSDQTSSAVVFHNNKVQGQYTFDGTSVGLAKFTITDAGKVDDENYATFMCAPWFGDCDAKDKNPIITIDDKEYTRTGDKYILKSIN